MTADRQASRELWTDAYLAGFARAEDLPIVSFDRGVRRFADLGLDLLA